MKLKKIAFIVGHNEKKKGALSSYFGMREYDFYNIVLNELKYFSNFEFDVYRHDENIKGYTKRIKDTAERINTNDYKIVISLHFNSFTNKSANGCETLYFYNSRDGKKYAEEFTQVVCSETNIKNRGVKSITNKKDRGLATVFYPNAPTILIEPFFGSSTKDCEKIIDSCNLARILNAYCYKIINNN
jgi:N-acetylmuramoyl-L-alanine amidase